MSTASPFRLLPSPRMMRLRSSALPLAAWKRLLTAFLWLSLRHLSALSNAAAAQNQKTSHKWKDVLPIDRPCLGTIDWWVSQPLFSFLDKPKAYPNFDAFPMQWDAYNEIHERARVFEEEMKSGRVPVFSMRGAGGGGGNNNKVTSAPASAADAANSISSTPAGADGGKTSDTSGETSGASPAPQAEPRGPRLLLEEYDDGTSQAHPVDGDYQYVRTYEHVYENELNVKKGPNAVILSGEAQLSAPPIRRFLRSRIGTRALAMETHKPVHQWFCYSVLKNLLDLLGHFTDPQSLGWRIQLHRSVESKLFDQDVNYLMRRVQHDLWRILMMVQVRFDDVHGVHPQILKPVFATLSHVARVRRNINFQRCVSAVRAVDSVVDSSTSTSTAGAGGDVGDGRENGTNGTVVGGGASPACDPGSGGTACKTYAANSLANYPGLSILEVQKHAKFLENERKKWKEALEDHKNKRSKSPFKDSDSVILRNGNAIYAGDPRNSRLFGEYFSSEQQNISKTISEQDALDRILAELQIDTHQAALQQRGLDYLYTTKRPASYYGTLNSNAFRSAHWSYLGFAKEDLVEETYENCYLNSRTQPTEAVDTKKKTQEEQAPLTSLSKTYCDACCHLLERSEGPILSDAWASFVQARRMGRKEVDDFYRAPQSSWIHPDTFTVAAEDAEAGVGTGAGGATATRPPPGNKLNHTSVIHKLFDSRFDVLILHHLENGHDMPGAMTLLRNELQLNHVHDMHLNVVDLEGKEKRPAIPSIHKWMESPLFVVLEKLSLPSRLEDIPVSYGEVQSFQARVAKQTDDEIVAIAMTESEEEEAQAESKTIAPRAVPYFFVLPQRDLIADAVRRKHALDCPISAELEHYRAHTDLFLEVGGFFGDCVIAAATVGWARYGAIELDGSRAAIRVLNKTIDTLFAKTASYLDNYPREYVFVHGVNLEQAKIDREVEKRKEKKEADEASSSPESQSDQFTGRSARHALHEDFLDGDDVEAADAVTKAYLQNNNSFPVTLNAFDDGKFLIRAASLFIDDKQGWFRPTERKVLPGRNIAEAFAQGANSFTGLSWDECRDEEYWREVKRVETTSGSRNLPQTPGGVYHDTVSTTSIPSLRPCMEFETVDGFLDKVIYPHFLRLHRKRFPVSYQKLIAVYQNSTSEGRGFNPPPRRSRAPAVEHRGNPKDGDANPHEPLVSPSFSTTHQLATPDIDIHPPYFQEDFLKHGILRIGVRIKVSGTEDAVFRGMRRRTLEEVFWLHVAVMPECMCEDEISDLMLQDPRLNFELVNEVRNNFREVMLLFQKKRRAA